jgi:iron(III) transport system ATP-binding protein
LRIDLDEGRPPESSARTGVAAPGTVVRARFMGSERLIEVGMDHDGSVLRATVPGVFTPETGRRVWLSLRREACHLFPCAAQSKVRSPYVHEGDAPA